MFLEVKNMPRGKYPRKSAIDRFMDYIDWSACAAGHTCWEWTGEKMRRGYGRLSFEGKRQLASHFSYEYFHKIKIPNGMCICHKCDNPGCVNPQHLFLGTQKDNIQDAVKKNRVDRTHKAKGEMAGNSKLTNIQVISIRKEYKKGNGVVLAKKYGVTCQTIYEIIKNETWKSVG